MTESQRVYKQLQDRSGEIRVRFLEIANLDTGSVDEGIETEERSLRTELKGLETRLIAARTAATEEGTVETRDVPQVDGEHRERLELRSKTGLTDYLRAAATGSSVTGAAAEFAAACKVPDIGHLPMAIFPGRQVEYRAVTPGPAVDGPVQPTVPYVFERSAAVSLGVTMPSVPAGQAQIPRITTAPPADTLAKDGAAPSTAAAVVLDSQSPVRIAGQFEVRVEDLAVMPSLEDALGQSMQGSLSNELDEQTFNGAAGELNGLFTQAADVAKAAAVETYTTGIGRFAALVDGRHAYSLADVRAVIGSKTFALYAGLFANANKGDVSLFDYLMLHLGSIRVSDRVPDVAASAQKGIAVLTASAEMPRIHVWDAMQIVRDPYSAAGSGKVTITATALVSPLYLPHTRSQVKEVHPKLS